MTEHNIQEKEIDLENVKKVVVEFEGRIGAEVRKQEKLDIVEEQDFRNGKLLGKYAAKMLYI